MEPTTASDAVSAFWVMITLFILIGPFVIGGIIFGFLIRNKREERQHKQNMSERLDIAIAEQRLQNLKREQMLEDEIHKMKQGQVIHETRVEPVIVYVDGNEKIDNQQAQARTKQLKKGNQSRRLGYRNVK